MGPLLCLDANVLITIDTLGKDVKRRLGQWIGSGHIRIPEAVLREIKTHGARPLRERLDRWQLRWPEFFVDIDTRNPSHCRELARMSATYGQTFTFGGVHFPGGFYKTPQGKSRAVDAQLVTLAKVHGFTVVSDERAIQAACSLENVSAMHMHEFIRRLVNEPIPGYQRLALG